MITDKLSTIELWRKQTISALKKIYPEDNIEDLTNAQLFNFIVTIRKFQELNAEYWRKFENAYNWILM
jgi:hypothetical protein